MQIYAAEAGQRVEAAVLAEAGPNPDDADRRRARAEAKKVETQLRSSNKRGNVSRAARSEASGLPGMAVESAEFDARPYLIADPLGVIDLRTGRRQPHNPALMLTQALPVAYDPEATCPEFEQFLKEAQPLLTSREYLKRREGSTLLGKQFQHLFHIDVGEGRNGKGVLNEVITRVLGPMGAVAPSSLLMVSRDDKHLEEIARLRGKRRVWIDEARDARSMDAARVKAMSGGTRRSARFMRANSFEYDPSDTIVLSTNQMPKFEGSDPAFMARLNVMPWDVSFQGREDLGLAERIVENEAAGVLRWLIEGVVEYLHDGLGAPQVVTQATAEASDDANPVQQWFREFVTVDPDGWMLNGDALKSYQEWATANYPDMAKTNVTKFGREVRMQASRNAPNAEYDKNLRTPTGKTGRGWRGLTLAPQASPQAGWKAGWKDEDETF